MDLDVTFLDVDDVLVIHNDTLTNEGGLAGVRDAGLLEAAVAMPRQRFGGELLHPDVPSIAAAYLYHLAMNHPFHDGNKRVAVMAALVFLDANGVRTLPPARAMERVTLAVAGGTMSKTEVTAWFYEQLTR
ncbi:MAG: type II toxin-antitoxin system death-on-curing family toxin [Phycisphaeraceae bacterium]